MADSINNQIKRLKENVSNVYKTMQETGYEIPHAKNSDNIDDNMSYMAEGPKVVEVNITSELEVDLDEYNIIELAKASGGAGLESLYQRKTYTITEEDLNGSQILITPDEGFSGMVEVTVDLSELIRILSEI